MLRSLGSRVSSLSSSTSSIAAIVALIAATPPDAHAQILVDLVAEGEQAIARTTQLTLDDPALTAQRFEEWHPTPDPGWLEVGAAMDIGQTTTALRIPLGFEYRGLEVTANVPIILRRTMVYSLAEAQAAGFGDLSTSVGYTLTLGEWRFRATATVKWPTGDSDASDAGLRVPLGTGTTDFMFRLVARWDLEPGWLQAVVLGRINTASTRTEGLIDPADPSHSTSTRIVQANGPILLPQLSYTHRLPWDIQAFVNLEVVVMGEGSTELSLTDSRAGERSSTFGNRQSVFAFDVTPGVRIEVFGVDLYARVNIPLVTLRDETNREDSRTVGVYAGAAYEI